MKEYKNVTIYDVNVRRELQETVGSTKVIEKTIHCADYHLAIEMAKREIESMKKDKKVTEALRQIALYGEKESKWICFEAEHSFHLWSDETEDDFSVSIDVDTILCRNIEEHFDEREILFTDPRLFGDNNEHEYNCKCYDGFAVCTMVGDENVPEKLHLTYPTLALVEQLHLTTRIKNYCGLPSYTELTFGDVAICMGKIIDPDNQ